MDIPNKDIDNIDFKCLSQIEKRYYDSMNLYINSLKNKLKKLEKWEYEKNLYKSRLETIKGKNIILHNQLSQIRSKLWISRFLDIFFCRNNQIGIEIDVENDRWSDLSLKDEDEYRLSYIHNKNCIKSEEKYFNDIDNENDDNDDNDDKSKSNLSRLSSLGHMIKTSIDNYLAENDEDLY